MNVKHRNNKAVKILASRSSFGLVPGNQVRRAIYSRKGPVAKKPCRSKSGGAFLSLPGLGFLAATDAPPIPATKPDPLYLFHCGMQWHQSADTEAGWELVQAMLSEDRGARAFAAELLARTEDGRLLVRDLRRNPKRIASVRTHHRKTYPA